VAKKKDKKKRRWGIILLIPITITIVLVGALAGLGVIDLSGVFGLNDNGDNGDTGGSGGTVATTTATPTATATETTFTPFDGGYSGIYPTCVETDYDYYWLCICMLEGEEYGYYGKYSSVWWDNNTAMYLRCWDILGEMECSEPEAPLDAAIIVTTPYWCQAIIVECTGGCSCMNKSDAIDLWGNDHIMHMCSNNLCGYSTGGQMYCYHDDEINPGATEVTLEPCIVPAFLDDFREERPSEQSPIGAVIPILAFIIIVVYALKRE